MGFFGDIFGRKRKKRRKAAKKKSRRAVEVDVQVKGMKKLTRAQRIKIAAGVGAYVAKKRGWI